MDLLRAIQDPESNGGDVPEFLSALSIQAYERYFESAQKSDIDMAIELAKAAIRKARDGHSFLIGIRSNLGVMLIQRYDQTGDMADLDEAIDMARGVLESTIADDPCHLSRLVNLTGIIARRYERTGDPDDLNEAIRMGRQAALYPLVDSSDPSAAVNNLGTNLRRRYEKTGDIRDLNEAILLSRQAVDLIPGDHRDRGCRLNNLAVYLILRYIRLHEIEDLDSAIEMGRLAIELTSSSHPDRANQLSNLGGMIALRYERTRTMADLEEAAEVTKMAIESAPVDSFALAGWLNNLWRIQSFRYQRTGRIADLNEGIEAARGAVDSSPSGHPSRPAYLDNLGNYLFFRYERTGEIYDLEDSINAARQAVKSTTESQLDLASRLDNLSIKLGRRYERLGIVSDLEEAIQVAKNALKDTPRAHSDWPDRSNNLGTKFRLRYQQTRDVSDLNESILKIRQAIESTPDGLSNRDVYLNNLGYNLGLRYAHTHEIADLDEAIQVETQAINSTPLDNINLVVYLSNLGNDFQRRYEISGDKADLKEASNRLQEAWGCLNAVPFQRVKAAARCLKLLALQGEIETAVNLGKAVVELLPIVQGNLLDRGDQQFVMSSFDGVVTDLCALLLESNNVADALRYLEQGRAVIISQLMDRRSDVLDLAAQYPDNSCRYRSLVNEVNAPLYFTEHDALEREALNRRREALDELNACIKEIRGHKGHERFLLGQTVADMQKCAAEGSIIVVNINEFRSDAIIVTRGAIMTVPLPKLSASVAKAWPNRVREGQPLTQRELTAEKFRPWSLAICANTRDAKVLGVASDNDRFRGFLSTLWSDCVRLVFEKLGYYKAARSDGLPRVWWVGTGFASSFPFHAAGLDSVESAENTLSWAISSYTPTIKVLYRARAKARARAVDIKSVLVVTMPTTPGESDLPAVQAELEAIQRSMQDLHSVKSLVRPSKALVLENMKDFDIIHFACHGSSDLVDPSSSFLALQDNPSIGPEKLTVKEILDANLGRGWLAYLSACSTAQNRVSNLMDEDLHLASSFQVAGFAHVVASMWPSKDSICAQVADIFYRSLMGADVAMGDRNRPVAEALHSAVKEIRLQNFRQPYLWAQYIHSGI
jgi:tetratricopeptide (TPR) repeat protein